MEQVVASGADVESILLKRTKQLLALLDRVADVGIDEIVGVISELSQEDDRAADPEKLKSRKLVMARMLGKSLQAGDPVFEKVSHAVYLATRGIVLGGSGPQGRKLAEMTLRQVGAVMLAERVVETAEVLVVAATVSVAVHGPCDCNVEFIDVVKQRRLQFCALLV
ncbi:hypothetical protein GH714_019604 [Hevea brasiliensis]|uniref:Uncharacterized protein n=1 Tax=Hevea brasiliensis TaxID=3981 RepID=A0A6A6N343_HEVBR|nr:hypothetical protein GH714_019604 [Hevea brasiliensis]